jgi:hypothetical protein
VIIPSRPGFATNWEACTVQTTACKQQASVCIHRSCYTARLHAHQEAPRSACRLTPCHGCQTAGGHQALVCTWMAPAVSDRLSVAAVKQPTVRSKLAERSRDSRSERAASSSTGNSHVSP